MIFDYSLAALVAAGRLRLKVLAMMFTTFKHRNTPSRHPAVRAF